MTVRRALGAGPEAPAHISAAQADLLDALPGVRLPDLDDMRERGVLGTRSAVPSSTRRTLKAGGHEDGLNPSQA